MYITNNEKIAKIAEKSGVDLLFIDLEINGKEKRQGHLDTVISNHSIDDVKKISSVLDTSKLLVRVNPIYENSKYEIDRVIYDGADIVMLPFFKNKDEVEKFIDIVNDRAKVMLLLETPEAVENLDEILTLSAIDYIHIGLNDLHLGYGMDFMFELLADGTVEMLSNKIKAKNIYFGFGGIAQLGQGDLPAENIIAEHYRLNSSMAILSRTFCNINCIDNIKEVKTIFEKGITDIRSYEEELLFRDAKFFENNKNIVKNKINVIVSGK